MYRRMRVHMCRHGCSELRVRFGPDLKSPQQHSFLNVRFNVHGMGCEAINIALERSKIEMNSRLEVSWALLGHFFGYMAAYGGKF